MKRIVITLLASTLVTSGVAFAATPTPTSPAPTEGSTQNTPTPTTVKARQIEDLKDRLATKVAELRQTQKKAIAGVVKAISISTITIETKTKDVKIELTDSISVFQILKGKRTKLTTDDLSKGDFVVVFGNYDVTLDVLSAKVIFIQDTPPERTSGSVGAIDTKGFTITLNSPANQSIIVDIEKTTQAFLWTKEGGIAKSGFSKIVVGDTVQILGTPVPKKEHRVSALRILDVGNLTGAPISTTTPTPTESATTPTPSRKPTPKPTPKPTVTPSPTP